MFTIPNEANAFVPAQAAPDKVDIDILQAALGNSGITYGCAVTAQAVPDMTVAVAVGQVVWQGTTLASVSAGNVTVGAADPTNPRFDLIVASNAGVKSCVAGTAAAAPVFPSIPANSMVLTAVYVPAAVTTILSSYLTDKRCQVLGLNSNFINTNGTISLGDITPMSVSTPSLITASGALAVTPAAGSNLNVSLSTTGDFAINTNQFYVDTSASKIGIKTASPLANLDIIGTAGLSGDATYPGTIKITDWNIAGPEAVGGLEIKYFNGAGGAGVKLYTDAITDKVGIATRYNSATWVKRLVVDAITGAVGIDTATPDPTSKLTVHGRIISTSGGVTFPDATTQVTAVRSYAVDSITLGLQSYEISTGNYNTGLGTNTGIVNTTGKNNTSVGNNSLNGNTTGSYNTALGDTALGGNVTGSFNVAIGYAAGDGVNNFNADGYVLVGYQAGLKLESGCDYNIIVGYRSGLEVTTGKNNVLLVAYPTAANANLTTGSNNIVVGHDIKIPVATGSNQLNIGNLIYGTGVDGSGSTFSSGGISIGSTANTIGNSSRLQVAGTSAATNSFGISAWNTGGTSFAGIEGGASRGAAIGTNTIVQNNDPIFRITGYGANGSTFTNAAQISMEVDGTPGATNDMPGRIVFKTTPDGSGSLTEAMRLSQDQTALFASTIKTASSGAGAGAWLLGQVQSAIGLVLSTTSYVEAKIDGAVVKLATVT